MLIWIVFIALAAFSGLTYWLGRRKALSLAGGSPARLHSLPNYYGTYVALWVAVPAALLLFLSIAFGGRFEHALLVTKPPVALIGMSVEQKQLFYRDAEAMAEGKQASEVIYEGPVKAALEQKAQEAKSYRDKIRLGTFALMGVLALAGLLLTYPRSREPCPNKGSMLLMAA